MKSAKLERPPIEPTSIVRSRLIERLDGGMNRKLVLICAMAGYGKTTLASQWAARASIPVAWVSIDRGDNDPARLYRHITTAAYRLIGHPDEAIKEPSEEASSTEGQVRSLVDVLAAAPVELAIVLDDYHLIEAQAIHDSIAYLIELLPTRCHVVLISRTIPRVPLARLRVNNQVLQIGPNDLRCTCEEIGEFFHTVNGISLGEPDIASLEHRTEGWIAGLRLAALSLQVMDARQISDYIGTFTGRQRHVWDYLAEEVFLHQPAHVRKFMMLTSVLGRFTAPLCDQITGETNAWSILRQLDQSNLLIPLDDRRLWHRYPQLIASFLISLYERELGLECAVETHHRASRWYERIGSLAEAYNHALAAGDLERCVFLFGSMAEKDSKHGLTEKMDLRESLTWQYDFAELPDEVLQSYPDLCLTCAWSFLMVGDLQSCQHPLSIAEQAFETSGDRAKLGDAATLRCVVFALEHKATETINYGKKVLELLPVDDLRYVTTAVRIGRAHLELGDVSTSEKMLAEAGEMLRATGISPSSLTAAGYYLSRGCVQAATGRLHEAKDTYSLAIVARQRRPLDHSGEALMFLGGLYYEWNRLDLAEQYLVEALEVSQHVPAGRHWPAGYVALSSLRWARGDEHAAFAELEKGLSFAEQFGCEGCVRMVKAHQARLWLKAGELSLALRWLEGASPLTPEDAADNNRYCDLLTLARLRIAQGASPQDRQALAEAVTILERLLAAARDSGRMGIAIEILALKALAHWHQGDRRLALESIGLALPVAEREHYVRTFVDEGQPMATLLSFGASNGLPIHYVGQLLAEFGRSITAQEGRGVGTSLAEPLSARELDVLRLIASGLSTQTIAERLVLSRHTVRAHVRSILAKLDAHSRIQAIEQARARNLIST